MTPVIYILYINSHIHIIEQILHRVLKWTITSGFNQFRIRQRSDKVWWFIYLIKILQSHTSSGVPSISLHCHISDQFHGLFTALYIRVSSSYFRTMGISILLGLLKIASNKPWKQDIRKLKKNAAYFGKLNNPSQLDIAMAQKQTWKNIRYVITYCMAQDSALILQCESVIYDARRI